MHHRQPHQRRRQDGRNAIARWFNAPPPAEHADRAETLEHIRREIEIDDDAAPMMPHD
jgi:hypothetical protein